jgi:hypothetical protein
MVYGTGIGYTVHRVPVQVHRVQGYRYWGVRVRCVVSFFSQPGYVAKSLAVQHARDHVAFSTWLLSERYIV